MSSVASATAVTCAARSRPPRLAVLRDRLAAVRRARAHARRITAVATMALAAVGILVAMFMADWLLALSRVGRCTLLLSAAGALGWAWWRHVRPWLLVTESDLDLALLVEREQGLDTDLVAALQFDTAESHGWGSDDLRAAVIDYVADFGQEWQVPRQEAGPPVRRRLGWLAVLVTGVVAAGALRPDFAAAFLDRMCLGSMHYPTRTRIESLSVAGRSVTGAGDRPQRLASPMGQPLVIEAMLAGAVPEFGRVRLTAASGGPETTLDLLPDASLGAGGFAARLPRLLESVHVQVLAGDAWTETVRVDVVPLPIIETTLSAEPPGYVRETMAAADDSAARNARQISVLEGSRVTLQVACLNKPLTSATLVIDGESHPLAPAAAGTWTVPAGSSPLDRVLEPMPFELRVVDGDGLEPERPITGWIRVKPDAQPQVAADVQTRLTLPAAMPVLTWKVGDDHGLRAVSVLIEPFPADVGAAPRTAEPRTIPLADVPDGRWIGGDSLPLSGSTPLALAPLGLKKGDQVRVTLEATDYRGDLGGRTVASDPIILDVTDEAGLLASLLDDDERTEQQIDVILEQQLEVGTQPRGSSQPSPSRKRGSP